jgi:hypothetical protein
MRHDDEDSAIRTAELHVLGKHSDLFSLPSDKRSKQMAEQRIAHVQLRDENEIAAGVSSGVEIPAEAALPESTDDALAREEQLVEEHLEKVRDLRVKQRAEREGTV